MQVKPLSDRVLVERLEEEEKQLLELLFLTTTQRSLQKERLFLLARVKL